MLIGMGINLRCIDEEDIGQILEITKICSHIETHSPYVYWLLSTQFGNISFVAENKETGTLVGFVTSIIPSSHDAKADMWQIAVKPKYRRFGVATELIKKSIITFRNMNLGSFEFSIEPQNIQSQELFERTLLSMGLRMNLLDTIQLESSYLNWRENHNKYSVSIK